MGVVIDASVWVSAARSEEINYVKSLEFLDAVLRNEHTVYCPTLALPETASGIVRPTNNSILSSEILRAIQTVKLLEFIELTTQRALRASEIVITHRVRGADSIYIALAEEFTADLVTWDLEVVHRHPDEVKVLTPTDWLAANV